MPTVKKQRVSYGGSLILNVYRDKKGVIKSRSWAVRVKDPVLGRIREIGLGGADEMSVAQAKSAAAVHKLWMKQQSNVCPRCGGTGRV